MGRVCSMHVSKKRKCNISHYLESATEIFHLAIQIVNGRMVLKRKFEEWEVKWNVSTVDYFKGIDKSIAVINSLVEKSPLSTAYLFRAPKSCGLEEAESEFWLHNPWICLLLHSCYLAEFQLMLSGVSTVLSQNSLLPSGYIPRNRDKITKSMNDTP